MNRPRAKLLIADCHEDTLIALQRVLEDAAYDTTAVWTAGEFLDAIHSQVFDLVLINEYMPGGRCRELLQLLREANVRWVLLQTRTPAVTGPATPDAGHVCVSVCKHDYAEIVRLVSELLANRKLLSAA
jgi:CheY-like chemotaxis protein